MRNRKGSISVATIMLWAFISTGVGAVTLAPSFRERKATEYCLQEGNTAEQCKSIVGNMDKEAVLAYIKDTQDQPR